MQVEALEKRKSSVSGHSEHCLCLSSNFPSEVLLKAVDNYVISIFK